MKGKTVKIQLLNQVQAIHNHLVQWGQNPVLDSVHQEIRAQTTTGTAGAWSVRNLEFPFRGRTVVAALILYAGEQGIHCEMAFSLCDTPRQAQAARSGIQSVMEDAKRSSPLPLQGLLERRKKISAG